MQNLCSGAKNGQVGSTGAALLPWPFPGTTSENLSFKNVFVARGPV